MSFWTDGSALPGGVGAGAVVGFVEGYEERDPDRQRIVRERDGILGCGRRAKGADRRGRERTYGERFRSFKRFESERGMRAEAWSLNGEATSFDVELSAVVRAIELCLLATTPGARFNIFTDSQASMLRLRDDRPGPGQHMAVRGIRIAKEAVRRGASITISWVPDHSGVPGNEVANQWAVGAAEREYRSRTGKGATASPTVSGQCITQAFLKTTLKRRAIAEWRNEILRKRKSSRGPYRVPKGGGSRGSQVGSRERPRGWHPAFSSFGQVTRW